MKTYFVVAILFILGINTSAQISIQDEINPGETLFQENCKVCHGDGAIGLFRPNLTDRFWKQGGTYNDVVNTISIGNPKKGIIAWKNQLSTNEIEQLATYIKSLEESTSSLAKKPEGDLWENNEKVVYEIIDIDFDDTISLYSNKITGLDKLTKQVENYSVFIIGENHTYTESNSRLWLKMIKYLNKNANVRNIMFEYGYSYGFLVNEYLKTGDTSLFSSIDQFAYDEYSNALRELKVYNDSLPASKKLYFTAIDIERGVYPVAKILSYLIPKDKEAPDSINLHVQSIKSIAAYNDYKLDEADNGEVNGFNFKTSATLDLAHQNFIEFEEDYRSFFGDNFNEFKKIIIDNYLARKTWLGYEKDGAVQEYIFRENYMHQRFISEQNSHEGNWFGQFGRCHTTQTTQEVNGCEWFQFSSLADRITNTDGGVFKGKVMTLAIIYENDRNLGPNRDSLEDYFDAYFEDVPENSIVLLDLTEDSTLNNAYGTDFNFIFLNTFRKKNNSYSLFTDSEEEVEQKGKFTIGVNLTTIKLDALNTMLTELGGNTINSQVTAIDGTFLGDAQGVLTGTSFGAFLNQTSTLASGMNYSLSGFYVKDLLYYNITKKNKWLDIMPGLSLGYSRLKLKTQETAGAGDDLNTGFIGEIKNTFYYNPAFIGDLSGIVDIKIGKFNLGYLGGYNFDFSKKEWKSDKNLLTTSPKTSFSGLFQTLRVGLNF